MFNVTMQTGRLLECQFVSPIDVSEVAAFRQRLVEFITPQPGVVICCDVTGLAVMSPDVSNSFVAIMKADNPKIIRSGFLVAGSATFSLQLERMIREAGNPRRRTFREPRDLFVWLGEELTAPEKRRLGEVLSVSDKP